LIDIYFWPTGNGKKITIMCEECALPYRVIPVNINKGDQSTPGYSLLNPNNKMPTIVDAEAKGGPITIFESGAILNTSAEKTGKFLAEGPAREVPRAAVGVLADRRPSGRWRPGASLPALRAAEGRIPRCTASARNVRASTR